MSRLAARRRKNIDDIFQSLLDLSDKIVAFEFPLTVPANLTAMKTCRPCATTPLA